MSLSVSVNSNLWTPLCLQVYQAFRINVASQCKVHKGKFVLWSNSRHMCTQLKCDDNHCLSADRLPNVYRINVPWFREDSITTVRWVSVCLQTVVFFFCQIYTLRSLFLSTSVPSVTEISGMLHTGRPDNTSGVLLQLHTAPNCQYKVLLFNFFTSW